MAQPVWVLSVDLQTKTATFQSGMADAAKSARGAFTDIKSGAGEMASETGNSFGSVRNKIGLLDNSIRGNHAAAMADLIHMFSQTSLVMNGLPFLATAGGFLLLGGVIVEAVKAIKEWRDAEGKLKDEQTQFGTEVQQVFNGLDEKLTQAGIRADELRNDHLGALRNELKLIDEQSMGQLLRAFAEIDKAADTLFGDLKAHWYEMGIGSEGAQHALNDFKTQYESLIAQGKSGQATDLLHGTLDSAQKILDAQKQAQKGKNEGDSGSSSYTKDEFFKTQAAMNALKAAGVGYTQKEVAAQQALVDTLNAQVGIEQKVNALKTVDKGNATRASGNEAAAMQAQAAREAAEHTQKMGELALAAQKEQAQTALTLQAATIQQRLAADIALADKDYAIKAAANKADIAALDKSGKDYNNQLQSLRDKSLEIEAEHANAIASLRGKAAVAQNEQDLQNMQEAEREKIDATDQGSAERLAVIDAAIKAEEAKNLQATQHYRELLTQRVEVVKAMAGEESKAREDAGKEAAENEQKVGELILAAQKESQSVIDSARRMSRQQQQDEEVGFANQEYALKMTALSQQVAALDKGGKDYLNRLKALQDQEKQLAQEHENQLAAIRDRGAMQQNQNEQAAMARFRDITASGLTQVIMAHESFAKMVNSIGDQVVSGMIQNALKSMMTLDMTKEREAAAAARKMYLAGASFPFPVNIVMAPALGAMGFAAMMAFQDGTDMVPGVGRGDIVPAMLEPGEGVVPRGVMEGLSEQAKFGGMNDKGTTHVVHMRPVYHLQALDSEGMGRVLQKHSTQLQKHFEQTVRRMNK